MLSKVTYYLLLQSIETMKGRREDIPPSLSLWRLCSFLQGLLLARGLKFSSPIFIACYMLFPLKNDHCGQYFCHLFPIITLKKFRIKVQQICRNNYLGMLIKLFLLQPILLREERCAAKRKRELRNLCDVCFSTLVQGIQS